MSKNDLNPSGASGGMTRRRLLAGATGLAATLAGGGLVSGCSDSGKPGAGAAGPAGPKVSPGPKKAGVLYPDGYVGPVARDLKPITTEKVSFSIVVPQDLQVGNWAKNPFTRWLEQRTGIRIEFRQVAAGDDMMTKINAMIAAGDLPDAFLGVPFSRSQLYLYGQQGLFPDLSGLIDGYAPNLQQAMKDYPESRKLLQAPDKKVYCFPSYNDCYHCRAGRGRSYLNTDWIGKVGLAMPKTTEEFRELLRAFKKADLGGNGKTIPFCGFSGEPLDTYFMNSFLYNPGDNPWSSKMWLVVNDGKADVTFNKDEWREGLRYLHGLYAEGLINKDVFTADSDKMLKYGNAPGKPIIGGARAFYWGDFVAIDDKLPNPRYKQYTSVPPLEGPNGVRYAAWDYFNTALEFAKFVITRKCTRPELLVQWADYQMELESIMRSYSGPDTWSWAKPGDKDLKGRQAIYIQHVTYGSEALMGKNWNQYSVMYRSNDFRIGQGVKPATDTFERPLHLETEQSYFPYKQPQEMQFPPVTLAEDQAGQEGELSTNLRGEVNQSFAKFVTGQLDPNDDAAWKEYLERIDRIGLKPLPGDPAGRIRGVQRMSAVPAGPVPDDRRIGVGAGIKDSRADKIVSACIYAALGLLALAVLYPLVYVLSASVSNATNVVSGKVWLWPVGFSLDAYRAIFDYEAIVSGLGNSVFYAVGGSLLATVLTLLAAYPLSRKGLPGKGLIMALFVFTMMFSGGMIPTYLVVDRLSLLNTRWALIVPAALAVWNVIITRTYFQVTIPDELLDAAKVDGCSDFGFFRRIVLPLSKPIIAVNMLFYAVAQWNSWFNALIYLTNEHLFPLQLVARQILIQAKVDPAQIADASELLRLQELQQQLKFSLIVIAMIPPLLVYPFVQKHFVKGAMIGSLKG